MLREPDVALTDFALAIETAILAWLLYRVKPPHSALKISFLWFYFSIGLAALLGGTFHGFFSGDSGIAAAVLWRAVMLVIGVTAFAAWRIGALLSFSAIVTAWISRIAAIGLIAYALTVLLFSRSFALAIAYYLPCMIFLTVSFALQFARSHDSRTLIGTAGLALTFVAAGVQHARISLHPHYFNHNAFYHLLQGTALLLIFVAARELIATRALQASAQNG